MQNPAMAHEFTDSYLTDAIRVFHYYKRLGERAIAQAPDDALTTIFDAESNSIAIIVKHMYGNMRSRWTDFLTSDGEKPDRNRDTEFETPAATRDQLTAQWEAGWKYLFDALAALSDADLARTGPDPQRTALRDAGHQSPDSPLFLPRRPNRISSQTFRRRSLDDPDSPARPIRSRNRENPRRSGRETANEIAKQHCGESKART